MSERDFSGEECSVLDCDRDVEVELMINDPDGTERMYHLCEEHWEERRSQMEGFDDE